jgi:serralysin
MFGRDRRPERVPARPLMAGAFALALVAGAASPVSASAGELDDTFDGNGKLTLNLTAGYDFLADVAIQAGDQKIVAVGRSDPGDGQWVVVRFNTDGSFDSGFGGGDGIVSIDFSNGEDYANAVAIQDDGKIVVAGRTGGSGGKWGIARLDTDGTLDSTFSGDGKVTRDFTTGLDVANDVAVQTDQKILVTGLTGGSDSKVTVARYTTGGTPDSSFSGDGVANVNLTAGVDIGNSVAIDSNEKIVVGGYASGSGGQIGLARFRTGGGIDSSFSGDGKLTRNLSSGADVAIGVAIQPADDKIVLAGYSGSHDTKMEALRYNADGTADGTFSGDGRMSINITEFEDPANSLALQDDGKIVLGGTANFSFFTVARLNSNGTLDTSFGDDGVLFANITTGFDVAYSVAIQADGNIVAAGTSAGGGGQMSAARFLGT